jgi:hypothetical protein
MVGGIAAKRARQSPAALPNVADPSIPPFAAPSRQTPTALPNVGHAPIPPFTTQARQPPTALPNVGHAPIPPFTAQARQRPTSSSRVVHPPTAPSIPPALTQVAIPTTRWLDPEEPLRRLGYKKIQWGLEGDASDLKAGEFYRVLYSEWLNQTFSRPELVY